MVYKPLFQSLTAVVASLSLSCAVSIKPISIEYANKEGYSLVFGDPVKPEIAFTYTRSKEGVSCSVKAGREDFLRDTGCNGTVDEFLSLERGFLIPTKAEKAELDKKLAKYKKRLNVDAYHAFWKNTF